MPVKKTVDALTPVVIRPLNIQTVTIPIRGITPLIINSMSEKAKADLRRSQGIIAEGDEPVKAKKKPPKDPQADYEACLNENRLSDGRNGFPATGFKASLVEGSRYVDGLPMTNAKGIIFVVADDVAAGMVAIEGEPKMFEAFPKNSTGVIDIRYRPMYVDWSANLIVRFNADVLTSEYMANLAQLAGMYVGVGAWRPASKMAKNGQYGQYEVLTEEITSASNGKRKR
jgi:hypothetical protein